MAAVVGFGCFHSDCLVVFFCRPVAVAAQTRPQLSEAAEASASANSFFLFACAFALQIWQAALFVGAACAFWGGFLEWFDG